MLGQVSGTTGLIIWTPPAGRHGPWGRGDACSANFNVFLRTYLLLVGIGRKVSSDDAGAEQQAAAERSSLACRALCEWLKVLIYSGHTRSKSRRPPRIFAHAPLSDEKVMPHTTDIVDGASRGTQHRLNPRVRKNRPAISTPASDVPRRSPTLHAHQVLLRAMIQLYLYHHFALPSAVDLQMELRAGIAVRSHAEKAQRVSAHHQARLLHQPSPQQPLAQLRQLALHQARLVPCQWQLTRRSQSRAPLWSGGGGNQTTVPARARS